MIRSAQTIISFNTYAGNNTSACVSCGFILPILVYSNDIVEFASLKGAVGVTVEFMENTKTTGQSEDNQI